MIYKLPTNAKRFATTVNNMHGSNANDKVQLRAERGAATSTVRDLVREEARLARVINKPDELRRVRTRIDAYCAAYTGRATLVATLRPRYRIPAQLPAPIACLESSHSGAGKFTF